MGDDARQRRLAHARRAPEDERGDVARVEKLAEDAVGPHQMLLTDILVDRAGAQTFCQRSGHTYIIIKNE